MYEYTIFFYIFAFGYAGVRDRGDLNLHCPRDPQCLWGFWAHCPSSRIHHWIA